MMAFGWVGSLRLHCLKSLKRMSYRGGCQDVDCHNPKCCGNRLSRAADGSVRAYLPHHKNQGKWR
jgi:hypothetical protein